MLSLSPLKPIDLYTFSPFDNKLPKSLKMHSAMRLSRLDLREVLLRGLQGRMHLLKLLELVEWQLEVALMLWLQVLTKLLLCQPLALQQTSDLLALAEMHL